MWNIIINHLFCNPILLLDILWTGIYHPGEFGKTQEPFLGKETVPHFLDMEALNGLSGGEPLYRVHECIFGMFVRESESVGKKGDLYKL